MRTDGQTRYAESTVGSSSPIGSVGDAVCVLIDPSDAEKAAIKSSLPYVLGAVLVAAGIAACAVFLAGFTVTPPSALAAAAVVGLCVWNLRAWPRDKLLIDQTRRRGPRVFTEASRNQIRWAEGVTTGRRPREANAFSAVFFAAVGIATVLVALHLERRTDAFLQRAVRGSGVVVEMVTSRSGRSTTWAPVVEFTHDGRRYRFRDPVGSNPPSWGRGDRAAVLYDPANPADARIDRGFWNRGVPLSIGAAGALFCSAALWIGLRKRRH